LNSDYSVLFCGDFFHAGVNAGEIRIGVKVDSNYSYDDCVKSAERIKGIPVDFVLAGHYQPDFNKESNLTGLAYRELLVNRNLYR
jgi:glyoxylase-like metal-dependent hydrolase (beta-lactamase superfamily II)